MPTAASSTALPSSSPPQRVVQVPPEPPGTPPHQPPFSTSTSQARFPLMPFLCLICVPAESAPAADITKVSFRLADGRRVQRTFWKADKVEVLYAFVEEQVRSFQQLLPSTSQYPLHIPASLPSLACSSLSARYPRPSLLIFSPPACPYPSSTGPGRAAHGGSERRDGQQRERA
jgi:hypothetical protein